MSPRSSRRRPPHRVVVVAYDRLALFEMAIATEVFGLPRPEIQTPWYDFAVCSCDRGPLRATGAVRVQGQRSLRALAEADTIILPGWRDPLEPPPTALVAALRRAHGRGARVVSICSGVFVLAAAGLLDGKRATTHWRYTEILRAQYPKIRI
jgi:AraC family transcriptional activator FtrA